MMVSEIAAPVLRNLVNTLCLEGLSGHLMRAVVEATTPYIGFAITASDNTVGLPLGHHERNHDERPGRTLRRL